MKRTLFAILLSLWSACAWAAGTVTVTVKGRVVCDGRGVANVRISDGDGFARTDEKGYYTLEADAQSRFVFVCVPAGYDAPTEEGVVRFFRPLPSGGGTCDFRLLRRPGDDTRHGFVVIADPQIYARKEFPQLAEAADDICLLYTSDAADE